MRRWFGLTHDVPCHHVTPEECEDASRRERDEQLKREHREAVQRMKDELAVIAHQRNDERDTG